MVLSNKPFSSASAAKDYYSHGDYYGSEGMGIWFGEGAKEIGLKGEFNAKSDKTFIEILNGELTNGQTLGRKMRDGIQHRPGLDLTFSCPKSFSIQMLLYANKEERVAMEKAMTNAVTTTLSFIEKQGYVIARKGNGGKEKEKLNKLTFVTFNHTTNRNLEPQAHMHCFLANVAKCKDGKFRSISYDKVLEHTKFLGQIFRNELALEVKKLGHELTTKILSDGSSSFELASIHPDLIKAFSTRREEIVELCKLYGVTTKEGRDKIVINSRKAKKSVKLEEVLNVWKTVESNVMKDTKIEELKEALDKVKQSDTDNVKNISSFEFNAKDLAKLCIEDITFHKTVFTQEELLKKSMKYSIGNFSVNEIQREIGLLEKSGHLIRAKESITTKEMLYKEKKVISYAVNGLGQAKQIIHEKHFEKYSLRFEERELSKNPNFIMNDQQKRALKHIVTSKDNIIAIEGLPGVGKSTVLNAVRDISGRKIVSLLGLGEKFQGIAPTASAAKTLKESANISSVTLHSFLGKYQGYIEDRGTKESLQVLRREYKKVMIFLDESSLVSTRVMHKLLKLQDKLGFRLVITGDTKQLGAVEAGKPFGQMLKVIPSIKLNKIIRQKDERHKEAIIASYEGDIKKTFKIHNSNIKEGGGVKF